MASSSGTSSGSSHLQNSGVSEVAIDQRKQKRMLSNRESARRSRMRKQKHLDDLMEQVSQLGKENGYILTSLDYTTQQYLAVEAENSVLRTQMAELSTRLQSLSDIIHCMSLNNSNNNSGGGFIYDEAMANDSFFRPWNNMAFVNQTVMMDMFQHC